MRYNQEYVRVANHITCLCATSIEIMDRLHAILRPYQQYLVIQDDARMIVRAEEIAAASGTYTHTARSAGQRCERGLSSKSKVISVGTFNVISLCLWSH